MQLIQNLGPKIKALREQKEMEIKELARKTGLTVSYVRNIENSFRNPSLASLEKIATALEVSPNVLMEDQGVELINLYDKTRARRKNMVASISADLKNLKSRDLEIVEALVKKMLEEQ